jgi:hypothetical protein
MPQLHKHFNVVRHLWTHPKIKSLMTYSLKEALLLKEYYSDKMIGQYLHDSKQVKIKEVIIEQLENDNTKFFVKANGQPLRQVFVFFREISEAAKQLGLISPADVLSELNQQK